MKIFLIYGPKNKISSAFDRKMWKVLTWVGDTIYGMKAVIYSLALYYLNCLS